MAADRKVGMTIILKDRMSKALTKASKSANKLRDAGKRIGESFAKSKKVILLTTAAITGAAAGIFMLTKKVSENGDAMIKGAQRLNMSTDAYQKFDHIMQISGTSMDAQRGAMTRFTRTARDAANGVKVAEEAFDRLDVSVKKNDGSFKSTEELIYETSNAFKVMPATIEKSALMMDMFGRSGAALAQMMQLGSDGMREIGQSAEDLGGIMTEKAAKDSEVFVDALTRMDLAATGVTRNIAEVFQPSFTRGMEQVAESTVELGDAWGPIMFRMVADARDMSDFIVPIAGFIAKSFVGMGVSIAIAWKTVMLVFNGFLAGIVGGINGLIATFNLFYEAVGGKPLEYAYNAFADTSEQLVKEMDDIGYAGFASMKAIDDFGDALTNTTKKVHTSTPALDKARDATDGLAGATKVLTDAEKRALAAIKASRAERKKSAEEAVASLKEDQDTYRLEMQIKMTNELEDIKIKAREARKEAFKEELEENRKLATEMVNAGVSVGEAFVDGFKDAEEGTDKFGAGMKSLAQETIMSALDMMQARITAYAAEGAAAAAAGTAGIPIIGPVLAAAAGAAMFGLIKGFISYGMSEIPGMADGGYVTGGSANRDSVPRMLMPGEYVMSKKEVAESRSDVGGGGSTVFNIELNSSIPPSRAEMKKFVRQNLVPALNELKAQGMMK